MWIQSKDIIFELCLGIMYFDIALKKESTRGLRREDGERSIKQYSSDMLILIFMRWFQKDCMKFGLNRRKFRNGGEELVSYCLFHLRIIYVGKDPSDHRAQIFSTGRNICAGQCLLAGFLCHFIRCVSLGVYI